MKARSLQLRWVCSTVALAVVVGAAARVDAGPLCAVVPSVDQCLAGVAEVLNVEDFGATGNGTTDDRAAIQAAVDRMPANGGIIYWPPGTYLVSGPIDLYDQSVYFGAGQGATILQTNPTGTGGGYPIFQVGTPSRCDDTGAFVQATCEGALDADTRTAGCPCTANGDCASSVCATTANSWCTAASAPFACCSGANAGDSLGKCAASAIQHRITIANLQFLVRENDSSAIDAARFAETTIREIFVNETGSPTATTGVILSDAAGALGDAWNILTNSFIANTDIGVWVAGRGQRVIGNAIKTNTTGVRVDIAVPGAIIAQNVIGPAAAGTGILDNGTDTILDQNEITLASGTMINFGATSTRARAMLSIFSGAATKYVITGGATTPMVDGCRAGSAPPVACVAGTTSICYFDIEQLESCVCNATAFTQLDGGGTTGCS